MLLDKKAAASDPSPWDGAVSDNDEADSGWTIILPFFNERRYIERTLVGLASQDRAFRLVLVDNGSTDDGAEVARAACRRLGLSFTLLREPRPGKVHALATGLADVRTTFVATCDADTWYPSDYLSQAAALLAAEDVAAAGAFFVPEDAADDGAPAMPARLRLATRLLPRQCHTGGAGQAFRTAALRQAGGFDPARWNWVLEDHEIMHRVARIGALGYGPHFWCAPAARERNRESIRWTLGERLLYHVTPPGLRDRFFYHFLAGRLRARRLTSARIRERPFHHLGVSSDAAPRPVCG